MAVSPWPYFLCSVQMKLKRRTTGEAWEVVGMQDTNDMLSLLTSKKRVDEYDGISEGWLVLKMSRSKVIPLSVYMPDVILWFDGRN